MMRISWQLCHSRRTFQRALRLFLRFLAVSRTASLRRADLALFGCAALRIAAKQNMGRFERSKNAENGRVRRNDCDAKCFLALLRSSDREFEIEQENDFERSEETLNSAELSIARRLNFDLDGASTFDFIVLELEALFARIPSALRRYYHSVYLRPTVLLRLFEIVD